MKKIISGCARGRIKGHVKISARLITDDAVREMIKSYGMADRFYYNLKTDAMKLFADLGNSST